MQLYPLLLTINNIHQAHNIGPTCSQIDSKKSTVAKKRDRRTNIETDTYLIESVVLALHVPVLDEHSENMFVERAREIALQQFVVVDGLGDHMPHKL